MRVSAWLACLAMLSGACGTVIDYRQEVDYLPDGDLAWTAAGENDCDAAAGYTLDEYMAEEIAAPELHVVGIYSASSPSSFGELVLRVERAGPAVLVLSAYEETRWTIVPGSGAEVDRVIATGFGAQEVDAPDGVEIEIIDVASSGEMLGLGVVWPSESDRGGECADFFSPAQCDLYASAWRLHLQRRIEEVSRLVERAEDRTGLALGTFHGCQAMTELTLAEATPRDDQAY